jgi:hypothetical protein
MKLFFIILFSLVTGVHAKITPPNYDFKFEIIENFFPTKSFEEIKKQKLKIETIEDNGDQKLFKIKLVKKDYSLDIYAQVKKDIIVDTYIRMPQYFSHDLFLKELQTKWKKQDKFKHKDGSSYYTWFNRDNMNILYQGSCSITCFPMFIEFVSTDKSVSPLYNKFNEALPIWK